MRSMVYIYGFGGPGSY